MNSIISLILNIVISFIVYKIFENRGFKAAVIFKLFYQFILYLITGSLKELFSFGIFQTGIILAVVFGIILISTAVEYFIYTKTNSFITYLILVVITGIITGFILSSILAFLIFV